jgi:hypothetical protein
MKDLHEILDDLDAPSTSGDKTIDNLYKKLYAEHVLKGKTYVEPIRSRAFGHWKYLFFVNGPTDLAILDLDSGEQIAIPGEFFDFLKQKEHKLW